MTVNPKREHSSSDPFSAAFAAMADQVAARIEEQLVQILTGMPVPQGIHEQSASHLKPFYSARELCERWGFKKVDSIYEIPENQLERRRLGSGRGKTVFYWLDVLVYEGTLTRTQADAIQQKQVESLGERPPRHDTPSAPLKGHAHRASAVRPIR